MKDTNQLPPSDQTGTQALWPQMIKALAEIDRALGLPDDGCNSLAQTLEAIRALQARAQVQGEPFAWVEHHKGGDNLVWDEPGGRKSPLYTTPQPAHAQQAASAEDMKVYDSIADRYFREAMQTEVTDEQIKEAAVKAVKDGKLSWLGFEKDDQDKYTIPVISKSHYQFARAILALRPEPVPMTEDQVWNNDALMSANGTAGFKMDALMRIVRAAEAHHGISAQAKKEGA